MIESIREATDEEWDLMIGSVGSALYFQTREWFGIWEAYAGFKSATKLIHFKSGKKVLLPLTQIKLLSGLISVYFLSPKGIGGFVTDDELDGDEKRELFGVLKKMKMFYCAANPYDALTNEFDGFNARDFTQVLDLSIGFEAILKTWTKGHYSAVQKGIREGIMVDIALSENDWKSYFALYLDSLSRWGEKATNAYGWALFDIMHKKKSEHIKLWVAKYQEQIISGALCFYHNGHVAYWHAATLTKYFKLNAPHVLQYHIIKDACEGDFIFYDFLPSSGHEGVIHFKNGFSPRRKPVNIYMSPFMKISDVMRKRLRDNAVFKYLMKDTGL